LIQWLLHFRRKSLYYQKVILALKSIFALKLGFLGNTFKDLSEDQLIFNALKAGQMEAFDRIYDLYRDEFLRSASFKFNRVPLEDLVDSWQDSVISFFEQIRSGRLTNLSCSIKTFLFLIGYRYIIKYKRHYLKELASEPLADELNSDLSVLEASWDGSVDEDTVMLMRAVEQMPVQSRRLLLLRYIEGKRIEEIMKEMNYNSANAVSVTLSRSLKKLKEMLEPIMKKS